MTTSSATSSDKKAGVIKVVEVGTSKKVSESHETNNRVSFSVPFFPQAISKRTDR